MSPIALPPELGSPLLIGRLEGARGNSIFRVFRPQAIDKARNGKTRVWNNLADAAPSPSPPWPELSPPRSLDCERPRCQEQRSSACCSASFYCELLI